MSSNKRYAKGRAFVLSLLALLSLTAFTGGEAFAADASAKAARGQETIVMADIEDSEGRLKILAEPEAGSEVVGKMSRTDTADLIEKGEKWSKIKVGKAVGYARNKDLLFGESASKDAKKARVEAEPKKNSVKVSDKDLRLLAAIIKCEAGCEPYEGQVAVGAVIMNRVDSGAFPGTISGVVYQSGQFTPARNGTLARALSGSIPSSCYKAAKEALAGKDPTGGKLYFNGAGCGRKGQVIGHQVFF